MQLCLSPVVMVIEAMVVRLGGFMDHGDEEEQRKSSDAHDVIVARRQRRAVRGLSAREQGASPRGGEGAGELAGETFFTAGIPLCLQ
jgi:hypothetical protein